MRKRWYHKFNTASEGPGDSMFYFKNTVSSSNRLDVIKQKRKSIIFKVHYGGEFHELIRNHQ